MSDGPVELRFYLEKASLQDIKDGIIATARLPVGPLVNGFQPHDIFKQPPLLEYRFKEKTYLNGAPVVEWSDWRRVKFVREGDEAPPEPAKE